MAHSHSLFISLKFDYSPLTLKIFLLAWPIYITSCEEGFLWDSCLGWHLSVLPKTMMRGGVHYHMAVYVGMGDRHVLSDWCHPLNAIKHGMMQPCSHTGQPCHIQSHIQAKHRLLTDTLLVVSWMLWCTYPFIMFLLGNFMTLSCHVVFHLPFNLYSDYKNICPPNYCANPNTSCCKGTILHVNNVLHGNLTKLKTSYSWYWQHVLCENFIMHS